MSPYLIWHRDKQSEVSTLQELDKLVDQLTLEAQETRPFNIELSTTEETSLSIVVGLEESHLEFYDSKNRPAFLGSHGPWDDDTYIIFFHGGEYSELPKRYWVPIEDAREALRQYFQTGRRPQNVTWGLDDFMIEKET